MNLESNYFHKQPICQTIQCNLLTLYTKRKHGVEVLYKYSNSPIFKEAVNKAIIYLNRKQNEKIKSNTNYHDININS